MNKEKNRIEWIEISTGGGCMHMDECFDEKVKISDEKISYCFKPYLTGRKRPHVYWAYDIREMWGQGGRYTELWEQAKTLAENRLGDEDVYLIDANPTQLKVKYSDGTERKVWYIPGDGRLSDLMKTVRKMYPPHFKPLSETADIGWSGFMAIRSEK